MTAVLVWAAAVYLLSYYRHAKRSLEQATEVAGTPSALERAAAWLVNRWWLRDPIERAVFWFTVKTALRSRRHWLILGGYSGVGLAFVLDALLAGMVRSGGYAIFLRPSPRLFIVPLALTFVILAGLRFIFTIPAELRANWIFRSTESRDRPVYHRAVSKAMLLLTTLPVLAPILVIIVFLGAGGGGAIPFRQDSLHLLVSSGQGESAVLSRPLLRPLYHLLDGDGHDWVSSADGAWCWAAGLVSHSGSGIGHELGSAQTAAPRFFRPTHVQR